MKITEKLVKEVIENLLSNNEKLLGYSFDPEIIKSLEKDYKKGQFGDIASLTTYIGGCLYGYVKINFPVTEVVKAIENGENKMIGVVEVEHIGCETVIRVNNEFLKCFPGSMVFLDPEGHLFYDLELGLFVAGYKRASIIENGTKVKILSSGLIGTVQGTDFENSEEDLSDLNYYIVPEGKTFNDELMVHKDDVFAFVF